MPQLPRPGEPGSYDAKSAMIIITLIVELFILTQARRGIGGCAGGVRGRSGGGGGWGRGEGDALEPTHL